MSADLEQQFHELSKGLQSINESLIKLQTLFDSHVKQMDKSSFGPRIQKLEMDVSNLYTRVTIYILVGGALVSFIFRFMGV